MATLADSLSQIPFYGAYRAREGQIRAQEAEDVNNTIKAVSLADMLRKQGQEQQNLQREQQFRSELTGWGENATQEQLVGIASRYGSPKDIMDTHLKSIDNKARIAQQAESTQTRLDQQRQYNEQMHEFRMARAQTDTDKAAETARHNQAQEELLRAQNQLNAQLKAMGLQIQQQGLDLRRESQNKEPLVTVMKDGKPVLVRRSDAVGMTPAPKDLGNRPMTATEQKEVIQTDEEIQGAKSAIDLIGQALKINDKAMGFWGAGMVSKAGTLLPESVRPETVDVTQNLDNIITNAALPQLKAIFGGQPTEGERKVLLEVQGSSDKNPAVRKEIFERAKKAVETRLKFSSDKAEKLRKGSYFKSNTSDDWSDL